MAQPLHASGAGNAWSLRTTLNTLLAVGVVFHLSYLASIFDIYFVSPLVHGMTPLRVAQAAPADRLVLFVADGLRADKLFEIPRDSEKDAGARLTATGTKADTIVRAPYLHYIAAEIGAWGVSHTRVPTESRPGHVAIIAGFYEDVSAVTKGWKMNPVEFDSFFNESSTTFSFGSPDILPMFSHGASDPDRVLMWMYDEHDENFASDTTKLDTWVIERLEELFQNATSDPVLEKKLRKKQVVFFLHLLGIDTAGHGYRPHSIEYLHNIAVVDKGVKKAVELIENFYGHDGKTAYVFTADHGMSNRGAHGDGHPDNTRTPLIAWGAGIRGPRKIAAGDENSGHDSFSTNWGELTQFARSDVNQADIAPLMAALIGTDFPVNSVGVLPLDYLNQGEQFAAMAAFVNAKQILAQYLDKKNTEIMFKPYQPLHGPDPNGNGLIFEARVSHIEHLLEKHMFTEAEKASEALIKECLRGLRYFQTYDWLFLRSIVSAGYLGWVFYSLTFVIASYSLMETRIPETTKAGERRSSAKSDESWLEKNENLVIHALALLAFGALAGVLLAQSSPFMYYVYAAFPCFFWHQVAMQRRVLWAAFGQSSSSKNLWHTLLWVLFYVLGLETLVLSYFRREVLSAIFVAFATIWPASLLLSQQSGNPRLNGQTKSILGVWVLLCFACGVFPLLSVELEENIALVIGGGLLTAALASAVLVYYPTEFSDDTKKDGQADVDKNPTDYMPWLQVILVLLACVLLYDTKHRLQQKEGLPLLNSALSWTIMTISLLIPVLHGRGSMQHYIRRLIVVFLSFAPPFILLSISFEMLFYCSFGAILLTWIALEQNLQASLDPLSVSKTLPDDRPAAHPYRRLKLADLRIAFMFMFFINVGFFGTGNIASVSSFSVESVYRFTTVFDPFLMGALLVFKILTPFFVLSAVFGVLARSLDLPPFSLFLLALSTTDVMTLNFFYLVRDDGSWLEIGTSISHFAIASAFIIFLILLFSISHALVGSVFVPKVREDATKKQS